MRFYTVCFLIMAVLFAGCGGQNDGTMPGIASHIPDQKPGLNFLVVSFDALRADSLGVYGYPRDTSPAIDAFSKEALIFEKAYSTGATTPPSFSAAFTGKLPFRSYSAHKLQEKVTLAGLFQDGGYQTVFLSANVQLLKNKGLDRGFGHYEITPSLRDEDMLPIALDLLDKHRDSPFFMWFHFLSPHTPYSVRPGAEHLVDPAYEGRFQEESGRQFTVESEADLKRLRDLYDGEVFYADNLFEKILDTCKRLGLLEKTVIVLTADHGEQFKEHGGMRHESLFDECLRVPLIIRHPMAMMNGRTALPYANIDLLPTLASMAGLDTAAGLDGYNLMAEQPANEREMLAVHMTDENNLLASLRKGNMKIITYCGSNTRHQLFDLHTDPQELDDLAQKESDMLAALTSRLTEKMGGDPCAVLKSANSGVSAAAGMNKEQVERLRSLGYIK